MNAVATQVLPVAHLRKTFATWLLSEFGYEAFRQALCATSLDDAVKIATPPPVRASLAKGGWPAFVILETDETAREGKARHTLHFFTVKSKREWRHLGDWSEPAYAAVPYAVHAGSLPMNAFDPRRPFDAALDHPGNGHQPGEARLIDVTISPRDRSVSPTSGFGNFTMTLITQAGAYPDIDAGDYHRRADLLPGPSLSSSGAKKLLGQSPYHFWHDSPLNPNRPPEADKPHFNVGKAAHDFVLLSERWPDHYHVTPEGFSRAASKKFAAEIAEADAAIEAGMTVLSFDQAATVENVAAAIRRSDLAVATLTNGVTEETLCWQDPRTGVWLRARPDFRPNSILEKREVMVVSDLKFVAASNASPEGFAKAIHNFGYHQSAAFYADGIKAIYGHYPTHWVHVVVEKDAPHCVALYELPGEDIERGRVLNRRAIDLFARCLERGEWPGYADDPTPIGLPIWARMRIDDLDPTEMAFAAAA